jgi:uncharacterized protein YbjT (DUF2867 family)
MAEIQLSGVRIALAGATGYVGGRLRRALALRGVSVRCLARRPAHLAGRVEPGVEVIAADCLVPESLTDALRGAKVAYYLVHSMAAGAEFEARDREAARNFASAARAAGLERIVYLGALADESAPLSPHLRSRLEVGEILRSSGVPVVELRASIVIGSGSLSFELVRSLVERLPVMVLPRWVETPAQPIGIQDLLEILVRALEVSPGIYEIGGSEQTSYAGLMREYAHQRGLRRFMIRVPVLTPGLSALWLGLVTPVFARVGRHLIESIRSATVVRTSALEAFGVRPMSVADEIAAALRNEDRELAETRWSDALSSAAIDEPRYGGARFGRRLVDARSLRVRATPSEVFAAAEQIGGERGWYAFDWLWRLRGALDLMMGGVGLRRGRSHPTRLRVGDVLDCWRVESIEPGRRLRLAAEMKVPGRAWLDFEVESAPGGAVLRQIASFDPHGLAGLAYWFAMYPAHAFVFRDMLAGIARSAEQASNKEM